MRDGLLLLTSLMIQPDNEPTIGYRHLRVHSVCWPKRNDGRFLLTSLLESKRQHSFLSVIVSCDLQV
jgi:hypothetical protein